MALLKLAFDKSARHIDVDGRLHVERSHISKANVSPYYGQEIPDYESLGLEPDKIYKLLRDPVELERGAASFARLPILSKHIPVTVDEPQRDIVIGAIGSDIQFNAPYLDADLSFWDAEAIAGIDTDDVKELSCAYRYVADMTPGEYMGQSYDGRMTEIRGNHLALVEVGRAGSDVVVADKNPFITDRNTIMKMSKLGKALFATFSAMSPTLAADSALPALVGSADRKTFNPKDVKSKLLALDEDLDAQKVDDVLDAVIGIEDNPEASEAPNVPAEDEDPAEKVRSLLAGKVDDSVIEQICSMFPSVAGDEDLDENGTPALDEDDDTVKKEDMTAAMDGLRADMKAAEQARRDVSATVGDVIGMDSAAEIYGFALDHMKVDRTDVKGVAALRALYKVASLNATNTAPLVAQDSATIIKKFPNLDRIGRA